MWYHFDSLTFPCLESNSVKCIAIVCKELICVKSDVIIRDAVLILGRYCLYACLAGFLLLQTFKYTLKLNE